MEPEIQEAEQMESTPEVSSNEVRSEEVSPQEMSSEEVSAPEMDSAAVNVPAQNEHSVDAELEQMLAKQRASIRVIGAGGGGNNTINRITEVGIVGAETIGINTDAQDLLYTNCNHKILIGKEVTKGLGAGSDPRLGEEAARESEQQVKKAIGDADLVFIT